MASERDTGLRVLVPGAQDEGPQWYNFPNYGHADVEFTTAVSGVALADHVDRKLFINPNALILMDFGF